MIKPALTYPQQLERLKERGLLVPDEPEALHVLAHHNYYRLSAYRFPFTVPGQPDRFQQGVTFTQLWELYQFDRTLRHLVLEGCKCACCLKSFDTLGGWQAEAGYGR